MKNFLKTIITNNKILLSYLAFFAGIGFGIAGISIPPLGYISSSLLILIAQLFILSAGFIGLDVKFDLNNKYFHARQNEITENRRDIDLIKKAMSNSSYQNPDQDPENRPVKDPQQDEP